MVRFAPICTKLPLCSQLEMSHTVFVLSSVRIRSKMKRHTDWNNSLDSLVNTRGSTESLLESWQMLRTATKFSELR